MANQALTRKSFWVILIGGMLTGMGNGSVFGAALMCLLGRGGFGDWGGDGQGNFDPATFTGFIDWAMIVFGLSFMAIMWVGLSQHGKLEESAQR